MQLPIVVSITQLRRETADVVGQVTGSGRPVFVTQYGSIELVLLTRRAYERLLRGAERRPAPEGVTEAEAATSGQRPAQDVAQDPLAVFGRLPEGTLFETKWGLVHADTAALYMEDGLEVRPFLSPERLKAALDDVDRLQIHTDPPRSRVPAGRNGCPARGISNPGGSTEE